MGHNMQIHDNRHQWFVERLKKVVWPTAYELEYRLNANAYINGIRIQNLFNAEGLWSTELEQHEGMKYFDSWQERNAWEMEQRGITEVQIVTEINELNRKMLAGELSEGKNKQPITNGKKVGRNDKCPCGSDKKYKKCCLHKTSIFQMN